MATKKGRTRSPESMSLEIGKGTAQIGKVPVRGLPITTINGSITGETMTLTVEPNLSVNDLKLLVQSKAVATPEQRGPSRRVSKTGITSEYSRVFLDGRELVDDDSILGTCGVKEDSVIAFAVGKTMGNKLRSAMRQIGEDFSAVDDSKVLAAVLHDLKRRMLGGDPKGARLLDALYRIFDTNFKVYEGVHDGCLTPYNADRESGDYIQWLVEENVADSFPFQTFFGIPVYSRLRNRQAQSIVGQAHPRSLTAGTADPNSFAVASAGYFGGPTGQQMACTAHFAGKEGTEVILNVGSQRVGRTAVSNWPDEVDDFAVVAMDVPCERTGPVSTSPPRVDSVVTRPATFQTTAIQNARVSDVFRYRFVAQEEGTGPASSQPGDSNAPWTTPRGRTTVGVHRSGGPGGDMSVVRLDVPERAADMERAAEPPRKSERIAEQGPEKKKQKTNATS